MITIIIEPPKNQSNQDRLVAIFKKLKASNKDIEINLKVAKRTDAMRGYQPKDEEVLIIFGAKLYQHVLKDINEFDKMSGNHLREVHKFSYFVRRSKKHYFIACMPPIDLTMSKPESFLAFESFMKSLITATQNFKLSIRDAYLQKSEPARQDWPIDVVENGYAPKTKIYFRYDEVKAYLYSLLDKPAGHIVAVDTETNGLEIWNKDKHDIRVISFATEDNLGHGLNLSLPGLPGCYKNGQVKEIKDLVEKYIFEKHKTFIAWNCGFDVFALCNFFDRSYRDFLKTNRIIDGMHLLHILNENRKIEGYNFKAVSRDLINFPQYSFVKKYLDYLAQWQIYSVDQVLEAASGSLKYAAEDAAGEYTVTTRIAREIDEDPIMAQHKACIAPKVMAIKLETEWNGLTIDVDGMAKGSISCSGWELENIVKPTIDKCGQSSDGKLHAEMFVISATTGRIYYGKPFLNGLKIGSTSSAKYFLADPGHTLVYIDLDSADLRSAALVSQDKNLIEDVNRDTDYYTEFAKVLFSEIEIGEKERNIAKLFILSMLNFAGDSTIAKETGVSIGDVKAYKTQFYKRYPKMRLYQTYLQAFLNKNNYIFSPSWRMRRFSEDDMSTDNKWKSILSAQNFPFQSTTSDLMILNCFDFISETREFGVKQCLLNVDAAVFNVPDEHLDAVRDKFKTFEKVHNDIVRGAKRFQELVFFDHEDANLPVILPRFTYKLHKGKNLHEMERW